MKQEGREMMMTGQNMQPLEVAVQLPESKVVAAENRGSVNGPLVMVGCGEVAWIFGRKADVFYVILRLLCIVTSLTAVSFMVTTRQSGAVSIYGFMLPVHSNWSFSRSFEYLVGVSAAVGTYSLLQVLITIPRLLGKSPRIPSTSHSWLTFAGDQVLAYAMVSAGAAASGVTDLNRTGVQHTALPDFCKPLSYFCNHVAISIAFTFLTSLLLAGLAVHGVIRLSSSSSSSSNH